MNQPSVSWWYPTFCDLIDDRQPTMEFSRQENWSGLPFPPLGIEPTSPALQADPLPLSHLGSPESTLTPYFFKFWLLWLYRDPAHPFSYSLILSLKCSVTSVKIKAEFSSCWTLFTVTFVIVLSHFNHDLVTKYDSLWPYELWASMLLCHWDSPGKNNGVCCHALLQGIFLTKESNLCLLHFLHWQVDSLPLTPGKTIVIEKNKSGSIYFHLCALWLVLNHA